MSYPGQIPVAGAATPSRRLKASVASNDDQATPAGRRLDNPTPYAVPYSLLFILSLPTVTAAWYWGTSSISTYSTQGVKSALPQYLLWLCLPFAIAIHLRRNGLRFYKASVGPFMPFLLVGLAASFVGVFPVVSIRTEIFWLAAVSAGVLLVGETPRRTAIRLIFYAVLAELVMSVLLAVLVKSAGTTVDTRSAGVAWRGVFEGRIPLSVVALWGIILTLYRNEVGRISVAAMLGCALLCLIKSHSAGTILALFAAGGFLIALIGLRRSSLSNGAKSAVMVLGCTVALLAVLFLMPAVVGALGRDTTFTGRTTIWAAFLPKALEHPILGQGPASFTGISPITGELYYRLISLGFIRTPHNSFIAVLGEGGFLAVFAIFGMLCYVAFILPFRDNDTTTLVCAVGAIAILAIGLGETAMVYAPDLSTFFLVTLLALRAHGAQPTTAPESTAPVSMTPESMTPKSTAGARPSSALGSGVPSLGRGYGRRLAQPRSTALGQVPKS